METILYDFNAGFPLDIKAIAGSAAPLIVGLLFLCFGISHFSLSEDDEEGSVGLPAIAAIIGTIAALLGIMLIYTTIDDQVRYRSMLKNDEVEVVEGYVENFHAMPWDGHGSEHFEINGVIFEYSDFELGVNGYRKPASHGGVVTHDGQHLKIKYVIEDSPMDQTPEEFYQEMREYEEEYEDEESDSEDYDDDLPLYYNVVVNEDGDLVWRELVILYIAEIED